MKVIAAFLIIGVAHAGQSPTAIANINKQLTVMKDKAEAANAAATKAHVEKTEWCRNTLQQTGYNIDDAKSASESAAAKMSESSAQGQQSQADISSLASQLAQNENDLKKATELETQRVAEFESADKELTETISTLVKAARVIKASMGGHGTAGVDAKLKSAMFQVAASLSNIVDAAFLDTTDKTQLTAFIQAHKADSESESDDDAPPAIVQGKTEAYQTHSSGIVDLLAELKQKAAKEQNDLRMEHVKATGNYNLLKQSLNDSTAVATKGKSGAEKQLALANEENAAATADKEEADKEHAEQTKTLQETQVACDEANAAYEAAHKDGEDEVKALNEAINILSGAADELGRVALIQTSDPDDLRSMVVAALQRTARKTKSVALAQLGLAAKEDPFGKVKGMIEDMIAKLQKQKNEEMTKQAWCVEETKKNEAKRDATAAKLEDTTARLEKAIADVAQLKEDIAELSKKIGEDGVMIAAATKLRTEEAKAFSQEMSDSATGLDALASAIAVLREYYSSEQSNDNRQTDAGTGVIQFLEVAQTDLQKSKTESEVQEKEASDNYTELKNTSEVNQATWKASTKAKAQEIARLNTAIEDFNDDRDTQQSTLDNTVASLEKIRSACTHQAQSFEERSAKMQQEIQGLEEALEILGAAGDSDGPVPSFLQKRA